ncbi:MAG: histone deacetylase [Thermoplasmata archaeon]|nr:histone deacetylase [Thermoplasmata archaeon]
MYLIYDPIYLKHQQDRWHPESPERLRGIKDFLEKNGLWENVVTPTSATVEDLARIHSMDHIGTIRDFGEGPYDMDTYVHHETFDIALKAAGGAIKAAQIALKGGKAFALVRPPGHHATRNRAMGFCYFNSIAIATSLLGKRTAIIDYDVHHGNGTHDAFYSSPDIHYISTHQWGIFPGTGAVNEVGKGEGDGFTVNIPLSGGSGDSTFEKAFEKIIIPIVRDFRPELLLVSIGGDAHYRDPLASLSLSTPGYVRAAGHIFSLAEELTDGGVAFMLEGGYDIPALSETVGGIVALARGKDIPLTFDEKRDTKAYGRRDVEDTFRVQKEYWNL